MADGIKGKNKLKALVRSIYINMAVPVSRSARRARRARLRELEQEAQSEWQRRNPA